MKKNIGTRIVFAALPLLFILACTKKPTVEVDNETQSAIDNAIVDQEFMVIVPALHYTYKLPSGYPYGPSHCDSLALQSGDTLFGKPGHVDPVYVMTNAQCNLSLADNRIRAGKIKVRFTGPLRTPNSSMIIKLQDYRSDGISYSCDSMVATVLSVEANNVTRFKVRLVNGICQSSTFTIKYAYDSRTFISSLGANQPSVSVFGTASGVTRDNRAFVVNIPESSPLVKDRTCSFISSGVVEVTPDGFKTRKVDFGSGNCDDDATFSVNGNTLAFKLK